MDDRLSRCMAATAALVILLAGCGGATKDAATPAAGSSAVSPIAATRPAEVTATRPAAESAAGYEGYQLVSEPRLIAAVALQINTRTISVEDVLHRLSKRLADAGKTGDVNSFRLKATGLIKEETERQVVEAMMLSEAGRNLDDKDKEQVAKLAAERLEELITGEGGARAALDAKMREQGSTLEELKSTLERQFTARYFFEKKFLSTLVVTHKELWEYYRGHGGEFSTPRMVQMQVAAFPDDAFAESAVRPGQAQREARAKALAAAKEALAKITAGEDFGDVVRADPRGGAAYRAGQGGLLDLMPAGSIRESKVEAQAFAQAAGQVSGVIEGQSGAFIVKTVEVKEATTTPFEKAQEEINRKIRQQKFDRLQQDYFRTLREKAHVIPSESFERDVLDLAVQQYFRGGAAGQEPARQ